MRTFLSVLFLTAVSVCLFGQTNYGIASYYAPGLDGRKTSSGERYKHDGFTCANKDYPIGTTLRVIRVDDGRAVEVRVNDCGPHKAGRIVDVSGAAAEQIGLIRDGITAVRLELVKLGTGKLACGGRYRPAPAASDQPASYENAGKSVPEVAVSTPVIEGQGTYRADALAPIQEGFGVQVGSYRVYDNASKVAADLQAKGYSKVLIRLRGNVHQVVLGPFENREAAAVYRDNLLRKYKMRGFVTAITQD
ncbi:septal ring lytic transglycosylase RlpA family protein [Lewinella cohaerens]|uniref:septal ring lytic transglycosylase RlpA family protein n=1 Tax=Lewinella cohaerens TaxID=70995 RepID=UPI000377DB3F|nr:septal ring lytic transglycosylase RlpA family protein [Lewinella cohaerens]